MPTKRRSNRQFDARPDRVDYRDLRYQPPLVSLPDAYPGSEYIDRHLEDYIRGGLVLDQGKEGACTGFGLVAVINYLLWKRSKDQELAGGHAERVECVSPAMLYHMARIYDEWAGEDYEGSSCRGAMKGWHRHGVCTQKLWLYKGRRFRSPSQGWQADAARRPLGAYYRIDKDSILDMQAAVHEVGAIYVSAQVHDGWFVEKCAALPTIPMVESEKGGHAFALVGYTAHGFIVQNSWDTTWAFKGFALMTYEDWIENGTDPGSLCSAPPWPCRATPALGASIPWKAPPPARRCGSGNPGKRKGQPVRFSPSARARRMSAP